MATNGSAEHSIPREKIESLNDRVLQAQDMINIANLWITANRLQHENIFLRNNLQGIRDQLKTLLEENNELKKRLGMQTTEFLHVNDGE